MPRWSGSQGSAGLASMTASQGAPPSAARWSRPVTAGPRPIWSRTIAPSSRNSSLKPAGHRLAAFGDRYAHGRVESAFLNGPDAAQRIRNLLWTGSNAGRKYPRGGSLALTSRRWQHARKSGRVIVPEQMWVPFHSRKSTLTSVCPFPFPPFHSFPFFLFQLFLSTLISSSVHYLWDLSLA